LYNSVLKVGVATEAVALAAVSGSDVFLFVTYIVCFTVINTLIWHYTEWC